MAGVEQRRCPGRAGKPVEPVQCTVSANAPKPLAQRHDDLADDTFARDRLVRCRKLADPSKHAAAANSTHPGKCLGLRLRQQDVFAGRAHRALPQPVPDPDAFADSPVRDLTPLFAGCGLLAR